MLATLVEQHRDRVTPSGESDCLCDGMVCRTPGIRVASRPEEAGRNQDCDTSFDGVLEAVSAGSTGHIGHTDKVSDPCGSTCVIPNDAAKSTRMRIDRI